MDTQQAEQHERPFQFTLCALMAFTTAFALVLGLSITFKTPELFAAAAIVFIAWLMRKVANANAKGIISWCISTVLLIVAEWMFRITEACGMLFVLVILVPSIFGFFTSFSIFFGLDVKSNRSKSNNICGILAILTPIALIPCLINLQFLLYNREKAENNEILKTVVLEVESCRARLGRYPEDEKELVEIIGKSLPMIRSGNRRIKINYKCIATDHFKIDCYYDWDIHEYDSKNPSIGWVRIPF